MTSRRLSGVLATALLLAGGVVAGGLAGPPARAGAGSDLLPDLRMQPLSGVRITVENGRRLLRFGAVMSNWGAGHFEVHALRAGPSAAWTVNQVVFEEGGGSHEVETDIGLYYAGDGHNHWHIQDMNYYDLWGPGGNYREAKIGFCFLDTTPVNLSLPGARQASYYREEECDGAATTDIRAGISIGWGDSYPWHFAYQWVDITGIHPGVYTLRSMVDPLNEFAETNDANNCAWVRVSIPASGNLTVLESGSTCIDDIAGTTFATDIYWLYDEGITGGCRVLLFCPDRHVTRGQMAAFLVRAMSLPPATADYFADDETSIFENDINRLAEAGITAGCATDRFCPDDTVGRDQMASFLARALDLPATGTDYFTDDEANLHEAKINALAEAGITGGCAAERYCPGQRVNRGQMAAFLHRAFG